MSWGSRPKLNGKISRYTRDFKFRYYAFVWKDLLAGAKHPQRQGVFAA